MINEERTLNDFGYTSSRLSNVSHKKVWCTCRVCGQERLVRYVGRTSICRICAISKSKHPNRGPFNIEYFNSIKDSIDNGSINELKTFEKFKYYSIDLSTGSDRLVYAVCITCKSERAILYRTYVKTDGTCKSCAKFGTCNGMYSKTGKSNPMFGLTGSQHPAFGTRRTYEMRRRISAGHQGIAYDEWESFACESLYCPKFNEKIKEANREKYGRRCFLCNKPEKENITSTGKMRKLSVHHVDMNKNQGCDGHKWKLVPLCMKHHNSKIAFIMQQYIEYILENE